MCDAASNPLAQAHTAQHSTTKTTTTKTDKALAAALPPLPPPSPPYAGTVGGGAPLLLATLLLCLDSRQSLNAPLFVFLLLLLFLACIYFCILYLLQLVQPLCFGPQSTPVKYADESYTHTSIIYKRLLLTSLCWTHFTLYFHLINVMLLFLLRSIFI